MNILEAKQSCIGCGACVDSCPASVLELGRDAKGFLVPRLKTEACLDCGACLGVCPLLAPASAAPEGRTYAYGWLRDETLRGASTSGGAFSALADAVQKEGGAVFAAAYTEDHRGVRMASAGEVGMDALRGTKYCQSDPDHVLRKAAEALKTGKPVLLVGTPCVIAAARNTLGRNDRLLLADFFCGGVVPASVLRAYTEELERRHGAAIDGMNMRDKSRGWHKPRILVRFENGKTYSSVYYYDYFLHYYYTPYLKNEPCLTCPFVGHGSADITLGDFWGYRKAGIESDDRGISLICANTERGREWAERLRGAMELKELPASAAAYAYKEKSFSAEQLKKRAEVQAVFHGDNFLETAKRFDFRYGVPGIVLKQVLKKLRLRR